MRSFVRFLMFPVSLLAFGCSSSAADPKLLTIGSPAPALNIEHWIHNGNGKFPKVEKFEPGKVYVVEFWATWCGPCVQSMPHLVELQKKYADKGLQIIGVSNEPIEDVKEFLPKPAVDADGKRTTFAELTKAYCLTTDPDGSTDVDYMLAAKQDGIPTAFIVGKDSKIDWIGSPTDMDDVLDDVIHDKWDRAKYKAEQDLLNEIQATISKLARGRKFKEAAVAIDGFIQRLEDPSLKFGLYKAKIDMLVRAGTAKQDAPKVYAELFKLCEGEPMFIQDVAWTAYEQYLNDAIDSKEVLKTAIDSLVKSQNDLKGAIKANYMDTLSHLKFVTGDLAGALAAQREAVKLADDSQREEFTEFLKELEAEKK